MFNANTFMSRMPCASLSRSVPVPRPLGEHWCLPGSGPLSGRQVADIAGRYLGRQVKLRSAGMTTLRIVGVFNKDLRGLLQVAPDYMKPVRYDARKLQGLLGPQQMISTTPVLVTRSLGSHRSTDQDFHSAMKSAAWFMQIKLQAIVSPAPRRQYQPS
jgi:hypothetical protein